MASCVKVWLRARHDACGPGPQVLAAPAGQLDTDRQPVSAHGDSVSDRGGFRRFGAAQRAGDAFDFQLAGGDLPGWFTGFPGPFERAGVTGQHAPEHRGGALFRLRVVAAQADQPSGAVLPGRQRAQVRAHVPQ